MILEAWAAPLEARARWDVAGSEVLGWWLLTLSSGVGVGAYSDIHHHPKTRAIDLCLSVDFYLYVMANTWIGMLFASVLYVNAAAHEVTWLLPVYEKLGTATAFAMGISIAAIYGQGLLNRTSTELASPPSTGSPR
jgi:hypothetical protein